MLYQGKLYLEGLQYLLHYVEHGMNHKLYCLFVSIDLVIRFMIISPFAFILLLILNRLVLLK